MDEKLHIVETIRDNKDILFSPGQTPTMLEQKNVVWKNIADEARRIGYPNDWKHLRDTTWKNWRRRTLEKRDNITINENDGCKKIKPLDKTDLVILDIIGHDFVSPMMQKMVASSAKVFMCKENDDNSCSAVTSAESDQDELIHIKREQDNGLLMDGNKDLSLNYENLIAAEQLAIAKRQKYKLDLELFKLEKELQIPPSKFTRSLHACLDPLKK